MQLPETLEGWLGLLEARHGQAIQLGLERVRLVRDALNLPQTCPVFTIGGTNGKGSTCALLEAVLLAAGYRVGLYTSPHLLKYNERVRIDGRDASDEALVEAFAEVERARGEIPLTYFEHGTLAAWVAFCRAGLDAIILEVGLGGRLDAVNVFEPDCAIVTSVAMDHMDFLGDNREAIGFEKAGIFRAGRPAICSDPMPPASLVAHAEAIGARLWVTGRDFGFAGDQNQWAFWLAGGSRRGGLAYPALRGTNQLLNASAVMAACEAVREILPVPMQAIRQGFMLVELPGRFQVLPGRPSVVLDVAHNPQAAGVLNENLASMGYFPETWAVLGMLGDKDVAGVVRLLRDRVDHWRLASLPGPRGLSAARLAEILCEVGVSGDVSEHDSPRAAYQVARDGAAEGDRIVIFGSFLTVADVLAAVKAPQ
ncbi:MAG: bifunctional tetrahydrofolate synthase/dihydrofolate synthase [Zoogloea sp.]|uniref:bifunctional tetrahydrofolate synthase/dihydrofolate synthase n=1 Tax=Zoogloea sp. TaxID=49181 RepID=UPI00260FD6C5|nr:bifunctional tetrahydrofolate synthase/dihydrofolate synthase [Zoogloea sp.]MDD3326778.1 bifunctional tetrahydrofolate synthase/dihydrofolate synthase [Zoogloea sp.]